MKATTPSYSFADILHRLALQDPEEKLRIAFRLKTFVTELHEAGKRYAKTNQKHRARRAA